MVHSCQKKLRILELECSYRPALSVCGLKRKTMGKAGTQFHAVETSDKKIFFLFSQKRLINKFDQLTLKV